MTLVTVVIPIASAHNDIAYKAVESAEAQTVKCEVIHYHDIHSKGAGWVRNRPAFANTPRHVDTPFVVFLDADDTLAPTFVEDCLRAYQTGKYVYTDWHLYPDGSETRQADLCKMKSHLVTTLYPTAIFRALGGFDETLPAHEDVDFYLRSMRAGVCGIHLPKPLVYYSQHGQRSKAFNARPDKEVIMKSIYERNGKEQSIMACCGNAGTPAQHNPGEQQAGDILAEALWAGMQSAYSPLTERVYNGGNGTKLYVAEEDVIGMKDRMGRPMFRRVQDLSQIAPKREQVLKNSGLL